MTTFSIRHTPDSVLGNIGVVAHELDIGLGSDILLRTFVKYHSSLTQKLMLLTAHPQGTLNGQRLQVRLRVAGAPMRLSSNCTASGWRTTLNLSSREYSFSKRSM